MAIRQPSSRSCFVCGRDNPVGLHVHWDNHPEAGEIRGTVTIPAHFNGYPGIAHGGIVAALLDETAGRSILLEGDFDALMVTAKLELRYHKPTPTDTPLALVGRLQRAGNQHAEAQAELQLPDGSVAARAKVLLVRPPDEIGGRWQAERPYWKVDG